MKKRTLLFVERKTTTNTSAAIRSKARFQLATVNFSFAWRKGKFYVKKRIKQIS